MDITRKIAKARFQYHTNMLDICNVLNQIGILKDEKAEMAMKNHAMKSFDCLERMGYDVKDILAKRKSPNKALLFFMPFLASAEKQGLLWRRESVAHISLSPFYFLSKGGHFVAEVPDLRADFKTV